jgi:hypothetical protein
VSPGGKHAGGRMRGTAFLLLLSLAACAAPDAGAPGSGLSKISGWQEASGRPPSQAEFAALVAACRDRAGGAESGGQLDGCLADLGLRRTQ